MTYSKETLRHIFQQQFSMNEWQQMLQHYFQATELRAKPERIDGTTEDEQGYYLGAIDTTVATASVCSITRFNMAMWLANVLDYAI